MKFGKTPTGNAVQSGTGRVVSLSFRQTQARTADPLAIISAHWNDVRRGRLVPERADIDPRALEGALSRAFVVERIARGLARFRIAGAHVSEVLGDEARGLPVSAVFLPEARDTLADALIAAFDEPAEINFDVLSPSGYGNGELIGKMLLLPLRSDTGDITRILGGLTMTGKIGRGPRRLQITNQRRQTLLGYAAHPPARPLPAAEPRPRLRLVVSNPI